MPDRTGGSPPLLPLSVKEKDSRFKDENHKLLNGTSGDTTDWVCSRFSMLLSSHGEVDFKMVE